MPARNAAALLLSLFLVGGFIAGCLQPAKPRDLEQRYADFLSQLGLKYAGGYNITDAEGMGDAARQALDSQDYEKARELLDAAFQALEKATPVGTPSRRPAASLQGIRVISLYERLNDNRPSRSTEDQIRIFRETGTDFIFRAWWRDYPCPDSPTDLSGLFTRSLLAQAASVRYTYDDLGNAVTAIKREMPGVIICGAIPAQFLRSREKNDITGEVFLDTSNMAFDPGKWGISQPRQDTTPDITNPDFQDLLLSYAQRQIDLGIDAIWIDLLYTQAETLARMTGDPQHPSVRDSYEAASHIVDEIHRYGLSKYGKHIYVGTWIYPAANLPYPMPHLDFVTQNIRSSEVSSMEFDNRRWDTTIRDASSHFGNIPVLSVLDWASGTGTGLGVFSQTLSPEQQREFLGKADTFFREKGILFVYPIHGGFMGENAKTRSFGEWRIYDSMAPEFQTYDTIKELARNAT